MLNKLLFVNCSSPRRHEIFLMHVYSPGFKQFYKNISKTVVHFTYQRFYKYSMFHTRIHWSKTQADNLKFLQDNEVHLLETEQLRSKSLNNSKPFVRTEAFRTANWLYTVYNLWHMCGLKLLVELAGVKLFLGIESY